MPELDRIVVVGAGECGARAVTELRARHFAGSITLLGAEPLAPYERPPLSKQAITSAAEPAPTTIASYARLSELDVDFCAGAAVTEIDRDRRAVLLADGRRLRYDRLLLATGARPRSLPIPGFDQTRTLRTYGDALALRSVFTAGAHVAVIGAGFIGLELAASARRRGCVVTVLEAAPRPLGRAVPAEIAAVITDRHAAAGVDVKCAVSILSIEATAGAFEVVLGDGARVPADVVVAGVGAVPNVELAAAAGLVVDNGIATDDRLRTSDPHIFAAGDCCSTPHPLYGGRRVRLEAWRNAHDQAVVAAANLVGGDEQYCSVPWFWSDQFDLGLQVAGLTDEATTEVVRQRADGASIRFGLTDEGRLVSASGVAPGTQIAKDIRIAERLIAARATPDVATLADPSRGLKEILAVA